MGEGWWVEEIESGSKGFEKAIECGRSISGAGMTASEYEDLSSLGVLNDAWDEDDGRG